MSLPLDSIVIVFAIESLVEALLLVKVVVAAIAFMILLHQLLQSHIQVQLALTLLELLVEYALDEHLLFRHLHRTHTTQTQSASFPLNSTSISVVLLRR